MWPFKALLLELTRRLSYCVKAELIPLMEVAGVLEVRTGGCLWRPAPFCHGFTWRRFTDVLLLCSSEQSSCTTLATGR